MTDNLKAEFEADMLAKYPRQTFERDACGDYKENFLYCAWKGYQLRASRASCKPQEAVCQYCNGPGEYLATSCPYCATPEPAQAHDSRAEGATWHRLKTHPEPFAALVDGTKPFEYRRNDRDFKVGDVLQLEEWLPISEVYTGNIHVRTVTYVLKGPAFGMVEGYCVLGLNTPPAPPPSRAEDAQLVACWRVVFGKECSQQWNNGLPNAASLAYYGPHNNARIEYAYTQPPPPAGHVSAERLRELADKWDEEREYVEQTGPAEGYAAGVVQNLHDSAKELRALIDGVKS